MSNVRVEGADELVERLAKTADITKIYQAVAQSCALVEGAAKRKVEKGNLRNSIKYEVTTDGGNVKGVVFTPVEYAPYVEFGTGLYAEGGKGRKEVPWVYVEGSDSSSGSKTVYATREDAIAAMMYLREQGLDARLTYGQQPKPFLRPAFKENKQNIKEKLREAAKP